MKKNYNFHQLPHINHRRKEYYLHTEQRKQDISKKESKKTPKIKIIQDRHTSSSSL